MLRIIIVLALLAPALGWGEAVSDSELSAEEMAAQILRGAHDRHRNKVEQERAAREKVVMYATSWCGYCKQARRYFRSHDIPFTEHDIEKSRRAKREYVKLGGQGVPLILVGDDRMQGFSAGRFKRLYRQVR